MAQARKPWFAPKRYGYGSGLPIAWEGWAALIGYLAVVVILARALPLLASLTLIALATALFAWLCATRTAGGWRWRSGSD